MIAVSIAMVGSTPLRTALIAVPITGMFSSRPTIALIALPIQSLRVLFNQSCAFCHTSSAVMSGTLTPSLPSNRYDNPSVDAADVMLLAIAALMVALPDDVNMSPTLAPGANGSGISSGVGIPRTPMISVRISTTFFLKNCSMFLCISLARYFASISFEFNTVNGRGDRNDWIWSINSSTCVILSSTSSTCSGAKLSIADVSLAASAELMYPFVLTIARFWLEMSSSAASIAVASWDLICPGSCETPRKYSFRLPSERSPPAPAQSRLDTEGSFIVTVIRHIYSLPVRLL